MKTMLAALPAKVTKRLLSLVKNRNVTPSQPIYTVDWFSNNEKPWSEWLNHFKGQPKLRFLEIGSYEGRATRWLLDNILTHKTARIYCVDTLEGSQEHKEDQVNMRNVRKIFFHNIAPHRTKVKVFLKTSQEAIRQHPKAFKVDFFDFIYIDGSHVACDVLEDAVLAFRLLKKNGIMIFDDYEWHRYDDPKLNPKLAIDAWLTCFAGQYEIIHQGYQFSIRKI
jgi:hypothetical protein